MTSKSMSIHASRTGLAPIDWFYVHSVHYNVCARNGGTATEADHLSLRCRRPRESSKSDIAHFNGRCLINQSTMSEY